MYAGGDNPDRGRSPIFRPGRHPGVPDGALRAGHAGKTSIVVCI